MIFEFHIYVHRSFVEVVLDLSLIADIDMHVVGTFLIYS